MITTSPRTSSKRLVATLTFIAGLSPAVSWSMPQPGAVETWLAAAAIGDDSAPDAPQADDLLRQARKAMADGHLQLADSCISRAEALNPKYSIFHVGDTPAKCRQDLNKRLGIRGSSADRGSTTGGKPDPFLARDEAKSAADSGSTTGADRHPSDSRLSDAGAISGDSGLSRLPPVDRSSATALTNPQAAASYPSTGQPPIRLTTREAPPSTPKAQSDALLVGARKSLAVGDVQCATALVEQAKRLSLTYALTDDSPSRVETLVRKHSELVAQRSRGESEGYRHQYAALLMEQAEGLLRWREFDEAERLALEAKKLPVQYNPIETRPDSLLQRIAGERRQIGPGTGTSRVDLAGTVAATPSPDSATVRAGPTAPNKWQAQEFVRQARSALAGGDLARAEQLARQADVLAAEAAFSGQEDRPSLVLLDIQRARVRGNSGVVRASAEMPIDSAPGRHLVNRSIYDPNNDPTRVIAAGSEEPVVRPLPIPTAPNADGPGDSAPPAVQMFRQGEKALADGNRDEALRLFRQAYANPEQLDAGTRQRLQDHLQMMASGAAPRAGGDGLLDAAAARQQVLIRQVSADVSRLQETARKMQAKEPKKALEVLQKARTMVDTTAELEPQAKQQLLRRVDESIREMQQYIQANLAQIELDEHNKAVHEDVEHHQKMKLEISEKLAGMVDEYNKLVEERRYAEAEIVAKRAADMDPDNPVVIQMVTVSKALRRQATENAIKDEKEEAVVKEFESIDKASIPDSTDIRFPGKPQWQALTQTRLKQQMDGRQRRSAGDIEIEQKLTTPVSLKFKQAPLGQVLDYLQKVTQVNMHVDQGGLQAEGVNTEQPITIDLSRDIQLKSALALILEPLHLAYVVKNEVLEITSEDKRHGQLETRSYQVADLVIPIPNFGPNGSEGISGALKEAYGRLGYGGATPFAGRRRSWPLRATPVRRLTPCSIRRWRPKCGTLQSPAPGKSRAGSRSRTSSVRAARREAIRPTSIRSSN